MSTTKFTLLISFFLVAFTNTSFWLEIWKISSQSQQNVVFLISIFFFLVVFFNSCLTIISFKYTLKPVVIFILLSASLADYFMTTYGVMLDRTMVQNIVETDFGEASELIHTAILYKFILLGILPALIVYFLPLDYKTFTKSIFSKATVLTASLLILLGILFPFYKDYLSLGKNYKYVRHLINPVNYIYATISYTQKNLLTQERQVQALGKDAVVTTEWQERGKNLVILVVGEAARAQNFSLNGYQKETNPLLSQNNVYNFQNTYSCGTATATSVPCMFSHLTRSNFSRSKADSSENVLDVLNHAGVDVLWRDNNSGSKGVSKRIPTERMEHLNIPGLCDPGECYDMVLLDKLQDHVDRLEGDALIVLHQKGNHGPSYYLRHPTAFTAFSPECTTNQLQECTSEEVANAYDNTLLYTDYFLAQVIEFLQGNTKKFNTAMIYMSDHGESLGESNLYLHGLPYLIAPEEQKHIPFMVWLSPEYRAVAGINSADFSKRLQTTYSHDNLFHSLLGLMGVQTKEYDASLDIFNVQPTYALTREASRRSRSDPAPL